MDFKPLITLLAIVNPLAIVPFFIHYTQDFSKQLLTLHSRLSSGGAVPFGSSLCDS